jgi:hypothetical protein
MIAVHSQDGQHFLGLRAGRQGGYEIVYDGGPRRRRFVWLIKVQQVDIEYLHQHLEHAIEADNVLVTLASALRGAEIEFEIGCD